VLFDKQFGLILNVGCFQDKQKNVGCFVISAKGYADVQPANSCDGQVQVCSVTVDSGIGRTAAGAVGSISVPRHGCD
jgi:hypothetical protein